MDGSGTYSEKLTGAVEETAHPAEDGVAIVFFEPEKRAEGAGSIIRSGGVVRAFLRRATRLGLRRGAHGEEGKR